MLALCGAEGSGKSTIVGCFRDAFDYYKWETTGNY
jgi:dephospho-CoA kinase